MDELQEKLSALLGDPKLMGKVMSMAQSFSPADGRPDDQEPPAQTPPPIPDAGALQAMASLVGKTGIDADQRRLLQALRPYMSQLRIGKLEKAMRSAKLASMATAFLGKDLI